VQKTQWWFFCDSDRLPNQTTSTPEPVLVVVDRSEQQWDVNSYFVVDQSGQLEFQWFETDDGSAAAGRVIVVVRPKNFG